MFENFDAMNLVFTLAGMGIALVGGKSIPLLRTLAGMTPSPHDDRAVELFQKFVDLEASKKKDG